MIRVLAFTLGIILAALLLASLADQPGSITIDWLGYQVKTSAFVGVLALSALVVLLMLTWSAIRYLVTRPKAVKAHFRERRRRQGYDALSKGLLAIGVGDRIAAQRHADIARRALPNEPMTALLKAQTAQLKGDRASARRAFEAMLDRPETELLGLRGMFLEAKRADDNAAARALAEEVVRRQPQLGWGVTALFDMQTRAGDWEGALNTLAIARQHGNVEPDVATRRRAVLLTAEALERVTTEPDKALSLVTEALRLSPSLIPAAEIGGRILASKGESKLAGRLIARTWKLAPHPDLATLYAFAKPGDPPRERLKRVKYLAGLNPSDIEGPIAVAHAAIEAHEWREAEAALAPFLDGRPPARVCALMARVEAGEGNKGREREWLARALRAPRDRAWIADGYVSDRWLPVSPVTGTVDAFQWKAPVDAIGRGDATLVIEDASEPERAKPVVATIEKPKQEPPETVEPLVVEAAPPVRDSTEATKRPVTIRQAEPPAPAPVPAAPTPAPKRGTAEIFMPPRAPDDPGVSALDPDESPASLERIRAAQIR
jgi:HemY protein